MNKDNFYIIFILISSVFMFCACEKKEIFNASVVVEQDSPIYSAYPDEIDESSEDIEHIKQNMYDSRFYIDDYGLRILSEIYDFLVVIPIKTKDDLDKAFHQSNVGLYTENYFNMSRCDNTDSLIERGAFFTYKYNLDSNETFFYKLYALGSEMKIKNLFDNIGDICFKYNIYENDQFQEHDYKSNTITIKAQEIKDMLDNLGIYYEDESN